MAEYGWPSAGIVCCWLCGVPMTIDDLTVDRVIPGIEGGTYARGNIRPACLKDNTERGGRLGAQRLRGLRAGA